MLFGRKGRPWAEEDREKEGPDELYYDIYYKGEVKDMKGRRRIKLAFASYQAGVSAICIMGKEEAGSKHFSTFAQTEKEPSKTYHGLGSARCKNRASWRAWNVEKGDGMRKGGSVL